MNVESKGSYVNDYRGGFSLGFRPKRMMIAKISLNKEKSREFLRKIGENIELEFIDLVKTANIVPSPYSPLEKRISKISSEYSQLTQILKNQDYSPKGDLLLTEIKSLDELVNEASNLLEQTRNLSSKLEQLNSLQEERDRFEHLLLALNSIKDLNLQDVQDLGEGTHFFASLGFIKSIHLYRLEMALDQLTAGNYIFDSIHEKSEKSLCLVGVRKDLRSGLERLLSTLAFESISFPEKIKGSPPEALDKLLHEKEELDKRITELKADLQVIVNQDIDRIFFLDEQMKIELKRIEIVKRSQHRNDRVILWAWLPRNHEKNFKTLVTKIDEQIQIKLIQPKLESGEFPTKITNNRYSRSFEDLVHGFGTPGYNEWDPTKFLSILIPIFFGIMFGDVIDGLVVFIIGLYGLSLNPKKYSKNSMLAELQMYFDKGGPVLVTIGMTAMFFGFLFGSYRGLGGHHAHEAGLEPLWFSPEAEGGQFALLELAIVLGVITIGIALIFQFIHLWSHNRAEAIFLPGMFFIFYISLVFLLFAFGPDPMRWFSETTGKVDLLALQIKTAESEIGHLLGLDWVVNLGIPVFQIFGFSYPLFFLLVSFLLTTIYHFRLGMDGISEWIDYLITMISNTISFARIFAYNIVHGSLSLVFIQVFAGPVTHSMSSFEILLSYLPGMIIGAPIVIGLELLVSFLQSLRLCWVEFFGKLHYVGSGYKFNPFKETRTYSKLPMN